MDKRAFKRVPVDLQARLLYGNIIYTGNVTDLSENGMFISTKMNFPVESVILTVVLLDNDTLNIPVKIKRVVRPENHGSPKTGSGLGVEIYEVHQDYLDYVTSCKAPQDSAEN